MRNPPIFKTPLNEERNPKRDIEEATPSSRAIAQTSVKRQRLNPFSKQDFTEETTGTAGTERVESKQTTPSGGTQEPSTSHAQILERQQSVELSSFRDLTN